MFQIFGDKVYSSDEIMKSLELISDIKVITDLTKSTKREDSLAFKCAIDISSLNIDEKSMEDLELFDSNMKKCESYVQDIIESLNIMYSLDKVYAYRYDKDTKQIIFIALIMYIESARKKLNDVFKRLIKNND